MPIGTINIRALGDSSVDTPAIIDLNVTDAKLASTLNLSSKTLTLPQASVTAHQGALSITSSQVSDLSIDTVLTGGSTTTQNLTVNDLTVNGTLTTASGGVTRNDAIAFAIALG